MLTGFVNGQASLFEGITGTLNYITSLEGINLPGSVILGGDLLYVNATYQRYHGCCAAAFRWYQGDPEFSGQARVSYRDEFWASVPSSTTLVNSWSLGLTAATARMTLANLTSTKTS